MKDLVRQRVTALHPPRLHIVEVFRQFEVKSSKIDLEASAFLLLNWLGNAELVLYSIII